jgi:hypothetical protein
MNERGNAYKLLVGKLEGNISVGRLRHKYEDNIKMDFAELE